MHPLSLCPYSAHLHALRFVLLVSPRSSHTQPYSWNAKRYSNLGWDVQQRACQTSIQAARLALVLGFGPEVTDTLSLVDGVEGQMQANCIIAST